jgi:hypothetical protein
VITTIVVIGNLLVDLLYAVIDPRAGLGSSREGDEEPRRRDHLNRGEGPAE